MLNTQLPKFIDISTIYHPGSVAFITLEGDEGKGKKVLKWISELKHELVHMCLDVVTHTGSCVVL